MVVHRTFARRVAGGALLTLALAACSSSAKSAAPNTTTACGTSAVLPGYTPNTDDLSCEKSQFLQALKNDPNDRYGWYNLGVVAQQEKDLTAAATDFERAIAIDPTFEAPLYNLGVMRLQAGDYKAATTLLTRAVAANENDANAHWNLGLALAKFHTAAGNERSKAELNKALAINPQLLRSLSTSTTRPTPPT